MPNNKKDQIKTRNPSYGRSTRYRRFYAEEIIEALEESGWRTVSIVKDGRKNTASQIYQLYVRGYHWPTKTYIAVSQDVHLNEGPVAGVRPGTLTVKEPQRPTPKVSLSLQKANLRITPGQARLALNLVQQSLIGE